MSSKSIQKAGLVAALVLPIVVLAAAWVVSYRARLTMGSAVLLGAIGNLLALVGLPLLVLMATLGSRFPLVERVFGLDRMLRAHKLLAKAVVSIFLAHALLETWAYSIRLGEGWQWSGLFSMDLAHWPLVLGRLALYSMVVLSPLAYLGGKGVPWRVWKPAHLLLYVAIVLGFLHARFQGSDMGGLPYVVVWYALVLVFAAVFVYRVIYRLLRGRWCCWSVAEVVEETHDTKSVRLAPGDSLGRFGFRHAGQFAILRLKRRLGWSEPRPFTISSPPGEEGLQFTIKRAGWFSRAVHSLPRRATVCCEGPYGVFCPDFGREQNVVMIAGGVGVTPFLSAIRHAHRAAPQARVTLIWGNKTSADVIAREELEALTRTMWLKVVHVFSQASDAAGPSQPAPEGSAAGVFHERGFVTAELLRKHVDPNAASFYLCGPPAMRRFVLAQLKEAFGIRPRRVKRELFYW